MKSIGTLFFAVLLSLGFAVTSFASIAGTAHDLSGTGGNTQICVFCHTPHNADATVDPLWNATLSTSTFTAYSSSTFDGTVNADPVIGPSRLCMSCHDGTVAIDSAIGGTTNFITGDALIGTDLTNDHPIGFDYDTAQGLDAEIQPSTVALGTGVISDFLFDDGSGTAIMTCATCHDVHNDTNGSFLLTGNTNSALCLSCHIK